jgi:hypothetical protein
MGHAYLAPEGCDEAEVLTVMSSEDEEQMQAIMSSHVHEEADVPLAEPRSAKLNKRPIK